MAEMVISIHGPLHHGCSWNIQWPKYLGDCGFLYSCLSQVAQLTDHTEVVFKLAGTCSPGLNIYKMVHLYMPFYCFKGIHVDCNNTCDTTRIHIGSFPDYRKLVYNYEPLRR